jgi:hypothetical protein
MLGLSLDLWNYILLASLALTAIATYVTLRLQKQETVQAQAELEHYKASAEAKVAEAQSEGIAAGQAAADANARAAEANEKAAKANERTALAETELASTNERLLQEQRRLADARWRLERVERDVLPRNISAQQAEMIVARLRALGDLGSIDIVTVASNEPLQFATEIKAILKNAGAKVRITLGTLVPDGTAVSGGLNRLGEKVGQAFWIVTNRFFGASLGRLPGMGGIPRG